MMSIYKKGNTLSRRTFLGGAGAVAIGAGMGMGGVSLSAKSEKKAMKAKRSQNSYDVIIVGAGFSGITAARDLSKQGLSVAILEGRSRIGGRTLVGEFSGRQVDYGGRFIHWLQPNVWTELRRYGIGIAPTKAVNYKKVRLVDRNGVPTDNDPLKVMQARFSMLNKVLHDAKHAFPTPYESFHVDQAYIVDNMTVWDRVQEVDLTPLERQLADQFFGQIGGGDLKELGLAAFLKKNALAGWNPDAWIDVLGGYMMEGGTDKLLNAIYSDATVTTKLSTTVSDIQYKKHHVDVVSEDDEIFTAKACLITAPLNSMKYLNFSPALPAEKQVSIERGSVTRTVKLFVEVTGHYPDFGGLATNNHPMSLLFTEEVGENTTIFSARGVNPLQLDINDRQAVSDAVKMFIPDAKLVNTAGYDWANDPFSMETFTGAFRPGQMAQVKEYSKPLESIFFGGTMTADGWIGSIDGAIESGARAARQIKAYLG